jgi:hypothetical protein
MAPKKKRYDKLYTLYADLSEEEVLRFKKYLALDRVTALAWVTEQVKRFLKESDEHYELLQLGSGLDA